MDTIFKYMDYCCLAAAFKSDFNIFIRIYKTYIMPMCGRNLLKTYGHKCPHLSSFVMKCHDPALF